MLKIIGRRKERKVLDKIWNSKNAELVAVYGRGRVGKTFLIREYFGKQKRFFELTGMKDATVRDQLKNFTEAFSKSFYDNNLLQPPKDWRSAFALLTREIEKNPKQKHLLFFDELPWLASKKSMFIEALDYYWNSKWSRMPNVKIILCGSAASWMLEKLINAKGGLHNRITSIMLIQPLSLHEAKEYLLARKVRLNEKHLLDLYMVMGGIPHYLNFVDPSKSAEQNIQNMCFKTDGILFTEFERLFKSLFDSAEVNLRIIREIARKREGICREELLSKTGMSSGGTFKKRILELQAAGFIHAFTPYRFKKKEQYFRVLDEYSAFYLTWIDPIIDKGFLHHNYWKSCFRSSQWAAWAGYAFESVCFKHLPQILHALDLDSIPCEIGNWRYTPQKGSKEKGAQIDLLLDRQDNAVTLCEIKYSSKKSSIDKSYAKELDSKIDVFQERTKTTKQLFLALITTLGLKKTLWSKELVTSEVTLKDLFRPLQLN